jgi:hypothetical protein
MINLSLTLIIRLKIKTDGLRPVSRLPLFACPNKGSKQRAPEALPCVAGFPQANR